MNTLTVPKKEYEELKRKASLYEALVQSTPDRVFDLKQKKENVTEQDVLRWSREAKKLKKVGKLPLFENLIKKEYPKIAKKYHLK